MLRGWGIWSTDGREQLARTDVPTWGPEGGGVAVGTGTTAGLDRPFVQSALQPGPLCRLSTPAVTYMPPMVARSGALRRP